MKKNRFFSFRFGKDRGGFTLTEVLLAVMIVGLIAVALAALTRAAARESGAGRSKIMLRNNLSTFVRTLRRDMAQATVVKSVSGTASCNTRSPVGAECGQQRKYDYPYCQGRHFVYHPRSHLYYILFPLRDGYGQYFSVRSQTRRENLPADFQYFLPFLQQLCFRGVGAG